MRAVRLMRAKWAGLCALIISGCANPPPPAPPPEAFPAPPAAVTPAKTKPQAASASDAETADRISNGNAGDGTDAGSSFDNLELVDASLNGKVAVLRVGSDPSANNLLSVFAGLKNKTEHRLALEVETIYKDKDGNALNAGSWIPLTLKPHEEREYRSASISADAVDFLVRVRRAPPAP